MCPEHIHITDNAIIPLKERVVDRFYDPVTRLLRVFRAADERIDLSILTISLGVTSCSNSSRCPLPPSPAALAKAERYRLLNEPVQSQSICEDVLRADPGNHQALVTLILALSDDFPHNHGRRPHARVELVAQLPSEYERWYYGGLVAERRGRACSTRPGLGARAGAEWLHEAMQAYERAEALRPPDNDEARLRWNACARLFNARPDLLAGAWMKRPARS